MKDEGYDIMMMSFAKTDYAGGLDRGKKRF